MAYYITEEEKKLLSESLITELHNATPGSIPLGYYKVTILHRDDGRHENEIFEELGTWQSLRSKYVMPLYQAFGRGSAYIDRTDHLVSIRKINNSKAKYLYICHASQILKNEGEPPSNMYGFYQTIIATIHRFNLLNEAKALPLYSDRVKYKYPPDSMLLVGVE